MEPPSQSGAVTLPAAPGSITSPPHEPPAAGRGASRHRRPPRSRPRNPPRSLSRPRREASHRRRTTRRRPAGERHGTAGHRGTGLAMRRCHPSGRAGKRHVAAARDRRPPGSVTAPPATAAQKGDSKSGRSGWRLHKPRSPMRWPWYCWQYRRRRPHRGRWPLRHRPSPLLWRALRRGYPLRPLRPLSSAA
jgi:hypothetical protein